MLLQEDILLVSRKSSYLRGFGWVMVEVFGCVVLAVPGSYLVLGWARRMFIWLWRGWGSSYFPMGNYFY